MTSVVDPILDALRLTWSQLQLLSPRLLSAILLLIFGWLLARVVRNGLTRLLKLLRLESAAEQTGIESFLMRGGVPFTTVTLIATVVYWLLMLVVAMTVFNVLGLQVSTAIIDQVADYLPNVLVALVIVVFGAMLSRFIGSIVETYLNNIGVERAKGIGFLARGALSTFVLLLALRQLQVGGDLLLAAFELAFGGLCLALALAFGLGGREWAAGIIQRTWKSQ